MFRHGDFYARALADSISPDGVRLTTMETNFPRPYLAEVNTHRVFSRNSASSRAIPTEKNIERVKSNPYVPELRKRVKGMGVGAPLDSNESEAARRIWLNASRHAVDAATMLNALDVDKSRANRLLEPFMWHTAIISSTEWTNFLGLRCPEGDEIDYDFPAQPEVQQLAILMRMVLRQSVPIEFKSNEWLHLPMVTPEELEALCTVRRVGSEQIVRKAERDWSLVSSRRLARVSFDRHTDDEPVTLSIDKAGALASGGHFSPMEHVAKPLGPEIVDPRFADRIMVPARVAVELANIAPDKRNTVGVKGSDCWCGNFRGWFQFRKTYEHESDHSKLLDYEVL
jgi:thymidylate synthase ThyX